MGVLPKFPDQSWVSKAHVGAQDGCWLRFYDQLKEWLSWMCIKYKFNVCWFNKNKNYNLFVWWFHLILSTLTIFDNIYTYMWWKLEIIELNSEHLSGSQSNNMIYECLNPVRSVHVDENDPDLLIIMVKACQVCKECKPDRVVTLIENN